MAEIDDLWTTKPLGPKKWMQRIPPDLTEFLDAIADRIIETGHDPNWTAVIRRIEDRWPDHTPARDTVTTTIRRLVKTRG